MPDTLAKLFEEQVTYVAVPATPPTPAIPGYWITERVQICRFEVRYSTADEIAAAGGSVSNSVYRCRFVDIRTYIEPRPASSGSPSGVIAVRAAGYNQGWNAGARSIQTLPGSGYVQFSASRAVGVVVGLSNDLSSAVDYRTMTHALYFSSLGAAVLENGVQVVGPTAYTTTDVFRIARYGTRVEYLKNGSVFWNSSARSYGIVTLDASLYSAGDSVLSPSIATLGGTPIGDVSPDATYGGGAGTFRAMYSVGGNLSGGPRKRSEQAFPAMVGVARGGFSARTVFPPMAGVGSGRDNLDLPSGYSRSIGVFAPMVTDAAGYGLVPSVSAAFGTMSAMYGLAGGTTGTVGGGAGSLRPLIGISSGRLSTQPVRGYSRSVTTFPAMVGVADALEGYGNASMGSFMDYSDDMDMSILIAVVMDSTGTVLATLTYESMLDADLNSAAQATTDAVVDSLIETFMTSLVNADAFETQFGGGQVWVVNVLTGASWQYENFGFNSFAKIGGKYYGAKDDGVYLLEGATDAGVPIAASVNLGRHDFNSQMLKRLESAYMTVGSGNDMQLKVTADDGTTYTYTARRSDGKLQQQRIDVGRGLKANFMQFEIANTGGADFELAGTEIMAAESTRRIK